MDSSHHQYPDLQALTENISSILSRNRSPNEQVNILAREVNLLASTFPSDIVTCQLVVEAS